MTGAVLAALIFTLAACVSTPEASRERDAEAKRFVTRPDAAIIYVYRRDPAPVEPATENNTVLYVDGRLIGATLPQTFFRFEVREGGHLLQGTGSDPGTLKLDTRGGELYFVSLQAMGGTSHFSLVKPETGKREILRCCSLLENWTPGQRPLVR
jgi:hypothetical protein